MQTKLIGIAGGSGSGKSTLSDNLERIFRDSVSVLHMDDYYLHPSILPLSGRFKNFDSPGAIDFEKIVRDVRTLLSGKSVQIMTRHEMYNPEYKETRKKISFEVVPKQILILEGFLVLYHEKLRDLMSYSIFLELAEHDILVRRQNNIRGDNDQIQQYNKEILLPMHRLHVLPTSKNADLILDVSQISADQVFHKAYEELEWRRFL